MSSGTSPAETAPSGTPRAEVAIDERLVRALLHEQLPDLAELRIKREGSGWDNALFRLGSELAVRLPRRAAAAQLVVNEQRWLPGVASRIPIPVPAPLHRGSASTLYPWSWSVVPWLDGETADGAGLVDAESERLAGILGAIHVAAPDEAPHNPVRGVPLSERSEV